MAGRLTLVKAVTNSMAIYPMHHDRIPNGIIQEIERLQRNFVWGEDQGEKRWHAIAWERLCQPKEVGGVGIKSLERMNDAFLSKILWRLNTNPTSLWVQVLLGKYGREWDLCGQPAAKQSDLLL